MAERSDRRRWMVARFEGLGWASVAIIGSIVGVWTCRVGETWTPLWVLTAGLGYLLLPAWPIAAVAAALRSWRLAIAAAVLIAVQLVVLFPLMPWHGSAGDGPGVTVASINLFVDNPDLAAAVAQIGERDYDVLVIQEFTAEMKVAFGRPDLLARYPHRFELPGGTIGSAIYSRFPLRTPNDAAARPEAVVTVVELPEGPDLTITNVHVIASELAPWRSELQALGRGLAAVPEPWLAIGDYNATFHHRLFRDLLTDGRRDAHLATGRGLARSWPSSKKLPPLELIDHAILSPGLTPLATSERTIAGSDHRMIVVELDL